MAKEEKAWQVYIPRRLKQPIQQLAILHDQSLIETVEALLEEALATDRYATQGGRHAPKR